MKRYAPLLIILLAATFLRLHAITEVPPGLTHDEADHGVDAWGVVNGTRPLYFTVGYGREPLYDYSSAILMTFLGSTYLASRLTSVFFSLILIAAMYAWTRLAFNQRTALYTAAGLAVSFWPVMTGRHALRTVTLPALFVLAVYFYWRWAFPRPGHTPKTLGFIPAGTLLGLTLYTYIPARALWLLLPALLSHSALTNRPRLPHHLRQALPVLLLAGLIAAPLLTYLQANPTAEVRLAELAHPLTEARAGNLAPLSQNITSGLRTLFLEGDSAWRYNIAGRPFLPPPMAALFIVGLALCLWHIRQPRAFFALTWLGLGLAPILITGAELSTTQAIGMQPILYLFPALALNKIVSQKQAFQASKTWKASPHILASLLFIFLFFNTTQRYFIDWATRPEVRLEYETSLITALNTLDQQNTTPLAISSNAPGRFHDPATIQMTHPTLQPRWFNGQASLLLPQTTTTSWLIFTGLADLHPALVPYLTPQTTTTLPAVASDLDSPITIHTLDPTSAWQAIYPPFQDPIHSLSTDIPTFGEAVSLIGHDLQHTPTTAQLITIWQIHQPIQAETVLFSHLLGTDGTPVAQLDRLDVPSYFWQPGDIFLQLHEIPLDTLPAGTYPITLGFYTHPTLTRLPLTINGLPAGDTHPLTTLTID